VDGGLNAFAEVPSRQRTDKSKGAGKCSVIISENCSWKPWTLKILPNKVATI
jgi:hypothetical protein